ncbi:MAG TPA: hypothetical protein VGU44_03320, partial [Gammaproteobacteria bacterium]|nr:hypothetical protein [Gammaproteobacteria bacterium]
KEVSLSLFKLMSVGSVGFAAWSIYSYLRGYSVEAIASAQMSAILFGIIAAFFFLYFMIKITIKKFIKSNDNVYSNLFELSTLLNKDLEKIKYVGASLFKKKPLLISGTAIAATYFLFILFKDNPIKKKQDQLTNRKS